MINNYVSPGSLLPQIGWKPQGFMAGTQYAQQEQDYANQMGLSNIQQTLAILKQQAEHQDYLANAPVRETKRGLDISTNLARTPIQGDLAEGEAATARATTIRAEPRARHENWKDSQTEQDKARELMGSYLGSILNDPKLSPAEIMMKWRDEGIPFLEREIGRPLPEQFKNMDPRKMGHVYESILKSMQVRQEMLKRQQLEDGLNSRNKEDNETALEIARLRERSADHRAGQERQTAATVRERARQQYVHDRLYELMSKYQADPRYGIPADKAAGGVPSISEQTFRDLKAQAERESHQMFYGGNPYQRSEAGVQKEGGEREESANQLKIMSASPMPRGTDGKIKRNQLQQGETYKDKDGTVYEYLGDGNFKVIQQSRPPVSTDSVIRR